MRLVTSFILTIDKAVTLNYSVSLINKITSALLPQNVSSFQSVYNINYS